MIQLQQTLLTEIQKLPLDKQYEVLNFVQFLQQKSASQAPLIQSEQESWENLLSQFINNPLPPNALPLTDAAISRESLYSREDD
ncbi:MAG: DUF2281 domain-containing protein [Snowella sp.]|nr:DUF2281 domain-containing protein [Snowella sp.]